VILGVQISKRNGCRTESEETTPGGVWKIKTRGAFSSRNIPFRNYNPIA